MAAIDDLKTRWQARLLSAYTAGDLESEEYNEALVNLDIWMAALTKLTTFTAETLQSYSINNRSATRRTLDEYRSEVNAARSAFMSCTFGNVTLADFRGDITIDPQTNT